MCAGYNVKHSQHQNEQQPKGPKTSDLGLEGLNTRPLVARQLK